MSSKIKETLGKQLQLLSERRKRKKFAADPSGNRKERSADKQSFTILSIAVLIQSILLLRIVLQIRVIYDILLLITERLDLLI